MLHHTAPRPRAVIVQGGRAQTDAYAWVDYLNELLEMDPDFMAELVNHRPRCNFKIATHPTTQVMNLNQLDQVRADEPEPTSEPAPYDNRVRYEDAPVGSWEASCAGIVYDTQPEMGDQVAGPVRDAEGRPIIPSFSSAMNRLLEDMPSPRWACGMLGVINGFLGIAEGGQGPIAAETDMRTGRISRFFVTGPYKRTASAASDSPENDPENS